MHQYKLISRKGEGTFSEVLKAQSIKTGKYVAIKCMKTHFTSVEQVNQLREIQALRKTSPHPHLIKLLEVLYDEPTGRLALVFELMDMNMYELIKDRKTYLPQQKIKYYMYQLFKAIDQMHRKGIFHRDIKPENILLAGDLVKLADLGSCRGTQGEHPYTEYISTRWYRSPECLMTDGYYDEKMDIWGAGCVMFEILTLVPLFPGKNELDMIHRIHNIVGTPDQRVLDRFKSHATHLDFNFPHKSGTGIDNLLPHVTHDCIDLLKQMLTYDPEKRITSEQVLQHEYFREMVEAEKHVEFRTTLSTTRLSPSSKQFQHSLYGDHDKSESYEKPHNHSQHLIIKKKPKKQSISSNKFPSLTLKVENILKQSTFTNDTSTEEEVEKGSALPPLKHQSSVLQLDAKLTLSHLPHPIKKNEGHKKLGNTLKPAAVNHYYQNKKPQKNSVFHASDYLVVGRKAS